MLRERVLEIIAKNPGIALLELRASFPTIPYSKLRNTVRELRSSGAIEGVGFARLRVSAAEQRTPPVQQIADHEQPPFIAPPSLDRLMAGR